MIDGISLHSPDTYVRRFSAFRSPRGDVRKHQHVCLDLRVKRGTPSSANMMLSHIPYAGREDAKHSEIFSGRRSGGMKSMIVWESFFAITSCQGKHSLELKPVSVSNPISQGPLSTVVHGRLGVVEQDGYFSEVNPPVPPTFRGGQQMR